MGHLLTAFGEEYVFVTDIDGATITVGLYNDSTAGVSDADDLAAVTGTEPSNANYTRQTDTFSVENPTGSDVVFNNDSQLTFSFDDQSTSETVDSYFVAVSFQSTIVGSDGSATDHLIWTGALSQNRDIGSIDQLNLDSGGVELELE